MQKEEELHAHLRECTDVLTEVFQSGFRAVPGSTVQRLEECAHTSSQLGLKWLAGRLQSLKSLLEAQRHQLQTEGVERLGECFCEIWQYLGLGMQKTDYDGAKSAMEQKSQK